MEYEIIREIKRSGKSVVHLVLGKDTDQVYVRKILRGEHEAYKVLQSCPHPYLPKLYEVTVSDNETIVLEEYIEGKTPASEKLSRKQFRNIAIELCCVLEFIHQRGIIHRDIKPSNILLAGDGHVRLIDFDAARMYKDEKEQDTRPLGTRGYAPPEQYGFAQTDVRADIYSLGVTLEKLLENSAGMHGSQRILKKCTRLDPDKRYQSVRQVRRALSRTRRTICYGALAFLLIVFGWGMLQYPSVWNRQLWAEGVEPQVLPAPENPRWDGETGIGLWVNVPESGIGDSVEYKWKLCRRDEAVPPGLAEDVWELEGDMRGNMHALKEVDGIPNFELNFTPDFWQNGFYYFAVSAVGDGVHYTDSPYVISDAFEYTGQDASPLPDPARLQWRIRDEGDGWMYFAIWDNLEDYGDQDSFDVTVYDQNGEYVTNNIWTKEYMVRKGYDGVRIRPEFLTKGGKYRFVVEVQTSRPNEYKSRLVPEPIPEEYFSPWYDCDR